MVVLHAFTRLQHRSTHCLLIKEISTMNECIVRGRGSVSTDVVGNISDARHL